MKSSDARFREIRAEDREMIRSAARRAGLSVSQWLDTVIKSAAKQTRQPPRSLRSPGDETPAENGATTRVLHERIEYLSQRIDQLVEQNKSALQPGSQRLEDAINRLSDSLQSWMLEVPYEPTYCVQRSPARPRFFSRLVAPRQ